MNFNLYFSRTLYLNGNQLESITETISQLTTLRSIDLSANPSLKLPVPDIARLVYLTDLRLNKISLQQFPAVFCKNMLHLRLLSLSGNDLLNLPKEINRLQRLEELHLQDNRLLEIQTGICSLCNLKVRLSNIKQACWPQEMVLFIAY